MRNTFLPFSPPSIGEDEIREVVDTLRSDWITTGPKVRRFEEEFAGALGASAALAVNSCTAALHTALVTMGVGPGDAVITTPLTFAATVNVIEHVGARPILADVDSATLNIAPDAVAEVLARGPAIDGATPRVLLPVHYAGHPCEIAPLLDLCRNYQLSLLDDAAHALPAGDDHRRIGSTPTMAESDVTRLSAFSFYATKNLTTAEGGMLTGPPDLIERARIVALHGMTRNAWRRYSAEGSWFYEVVTPGFKYNMTDIQAALGLHQLRRLPMLQLRRSSIAQRYMDAFRHLPELQVPWVRPTVEHAWHLFVLRLNEDQLRIGRDQFIEELKRRNIGCSVHFIPVHVHPYYRDKYGYRPEDFPVAWSEYRRMISLPLNPRMSDVDVDDVIAAVLDIVDSFPA